MTDSNDPKKFALEIEADMLPVLAHALIIQRNTSMMTRHDRIETYLTDMIEQVKDAFPAVVSLFSYADTENWSEIFLAVREATQTVEIARIEPANSWEKGSQFRLIVDGKSRHAMTTSYDRRFPVDSDEFRLLEGEIRRIAPIEVEIIVPEPEPRRAWNF